MYVYTVSNVLSILWYLLFITTDTMNVCMQDRYLHVFDVFVNILFFKRVQ